MGCKRFFETLPLQLLDFDMSSLTYAQDSRSYLLPLVKQRLAERGTGGDLAFFVTYLVPTIGSLEAQRKLQLASREGSEIKAKKYEALII